MIDYTINEMIDLVKDGANKILESAENHELVRFNALFYGPIAYKLFNIIKNSMLIIMLDPKAVYNRAKNCDCDLDWPEFWNNSTMIIALAEYLNFAKTDEDKIYASSH